MSTSLLRASVLALCALGVSTIACNDAAKDDSESSENAATGVDGAPGSMVGGHNMTFFGTGEKLYLSHIPLYANPHGKQVLVEVTVDSGVPADGLAQFNTNNFTVAPAAAMSLVDFASGRVPSITGTIFFGNLESGGRPIYRNVKFGVKKVVFQKTLSSTTAVNPDLQYIAVGTPSNAYLVHVIDKAPSFDQVVAVKLPANSSLTAEALDAGTIVTVNGGVNGIRTRLAANVTVQAKPEITVTPAPTPASSTKTEGTLLEGNPVWRKNAAGVEEVPNVITIPPTDALTVVKELGCLPGPEFYGACPAVAVTH